MFPLEFRSRSLFGHPGFWAWLQMSGNLEVERKGALFAVKWPRALLIGQIMIRPYFTHVDWLREQSARRDLHGFAPNTFS